MMLTVKNKKVASKVVIRKTLPEKAFGLMFSRKIKDEAHVFVFKEPRKISLHMWFVFYSIDVLYLDDDLKIVEIKENFKPFTFYVPKHETRIVIELPQGTIKTKNLKLKDKIILNKELPYF